MTPPSSHRRCARGIVAAALLLALAGCWPGVESATFMNVAPRPEDAPVRIFSSQLPACDYDEVGLVVWKSPTGLDGLQKGVEKMQRRAREMGGHAIVGFGIDERTTGLSTSVHSDSTGTSVGSTVDTEGVLKGTVIRFRDPDCAT